MDRLLTKTVGFTGGIIENFPPVFQGEQLPGSLLDGKNFESDQDGGYKRITGYTKWEPLAVPGSGRVKGVSVFNEGVVAARENIGETGTDLFYSTGTGWGTAINSILFDSTSTKFRGHIYDWVTREIILVNGVDYPAKFDGTSFTHLTNAAFPKIPTDLEGAISVWSFKRHMFLLKDSKLYFSAPGDETSFSPIDGGGVIPLEREATGLFSFRDALYIFGHNSIRKLTGENATNFKIESVTEELGTVDQDSIKELSGDLIYLSHDGIRTLAATERIGDTELGTISRNVDKRVVGLGFGSVTSETSAVTVKEKNQYRVFVGDTQQIDANARGIIANIRTNTQGQQWEFFDILGIQVACADSLIDGEEEFVIHGDFSGFVFRQERGDSFDGKPVNARIQFPYWTYDDNEVRKTLHRLRLYMTAEGPTSPTIGYILDFLDPDKIQPPTIDGSAGISGFVIWDGIDTFWDQANWDTETNTLTSFNLVGTCFNSSFFIQSNDTKAPYTVQMATVQYGIGGRK